MTDTNDSAATILALEARRRLAMLAADCDTLRELFDKSLVYHHSTGARDDREGYLARLARREIVYEALTLDVHGIETGERLALMRGAMDATVRTAGGLLAVASQYEAAWMRSDGAWRLVALESFRPGT